VIVRFAIAAIFKLLGASVEGRKPLQDPILGRQQEQRPAGGGVAATVPCSSRWCRIF
jgi:hypothetical protein